MPKGLEELVYRIRQEFVRHVDGGYVEKIGIIRGTYHSSYCHWCFKADVGYGNQVSVCVRTEDIWEHGFNLSSDIDEILIGRYRRGERYPDIELRSGGHVWQHALLHEQNVADSSENRWLGKSMMMNKCYKMWENHMLEHMGKPMAIDFAKEELKKESRKELLARTRPERLARLWKAMYERTGIKPKTLI